MSEGKGTQWSGKKLFLIWTTMYNILTKIFSYYKLRTGINIDWPAKRAKNVQFLNRCQQDRNNLFSNIVTKKEAWISHITKRPYFLNMLYTTYLMFDFVEDIRMYHWIWRLWSNFNFFRSFNFLTDLISQLINFFAATGQTEPKRTTKKPQQESPFSTNWVKKKKDKIGSI